MRPCMDGSREKAARVRMCPTKMRRGDEGEEKGDGFLVLTQGFMLNLTLTQLQFKKQTEGTILVNLNNLRDL